MPAKIIRTLVHAELQIVWNALMDSLENPQKYSPDIKECRVVKTAEYEFLREIHVFDTCYKEKISVNSVAKEICLEIVDHPVCFGKIVIKVVPTSVQNPMAPVDLQYFLELELNGKGENLISTLMEEQRRLKEISEELERNDVTVHNDRRFHHPV